ncbi:MAG: glycerate kinase [Gemmatimonadota bacterium]
MQVLVCPTAFKGTLTASEAARAMAQGVCRAQPRAHLTALPLSDGGPGLIEAVRTVQDGREERWVVAGPLSEPVEARCLWVTQGEALVESADACGLHLLGRRRAALDAHTLGVGELVRYALGAGARRVHIGLGGSASTDGGTGLARTFGYRFLDGEGRDLPLGGRSLHALAAIKPGERPPGTFVALADVGHTLAQAAPTFGPQKGASHEEVALLAKGLERLERRLRLDLGVSVAGISGSGAAGGLGAGCAAFLGAEVVWGSDWVLEEVGFQDALEAADLVMTGEGGFDATSRTGKIVGEVMRRATEAGVPVVLVCGRIEGPIPDARATLDAGGGLLDTEGLTELAARVLRSLG